jgi:imidazolonepropionase-like amidohydrolase
MNRFKLSQGDSLMKEKWILFVLPLVVAAWLGTVPLPPKASAEEKAPSQILIKNVWIFDGKNEKLAVGMNVLVEGNLIKKISSGRIQARPDATVIDGGGRTLIPGLIDAHAHLTLHGSLFQIRNELGWMYLGAKSGAEAQRMLMRGFTTARDTCGAAIGLRKAIDAGHVDGPRIYAAGPCLSQTGGHGDFRGLNEVNYYFTRTSTPKDVLEYFYLADGVPEVQKATREIFRKGASLVKIMAGGGIATAYDPLDGLQFTPEEMRAIVIEAEKVGSYAMVHAYTPEAIRIALEAGVKSIDHGMLIDEPTMKLLAKKGAFLDPQLAVGLYTPEELSFAWPTKEMQEKGRRVLAGLDNEIKLAKKYKVKIAFGTDAFGPSRKEFEIQLQEFRARLKYFTPVEILRQATSVNGELMALSGPMMNPYKKGPLGVIKEGAYADMLIVDGNPLTDILVLENPWKNLRLIMKDGKIYKNTLR